MTDEQAIIKLGLKTGAGSFARKVGPSDNSVRYSARYILHSVYDSLDRLATASERTSSGLNIIIIVLSHHSDSTHVRLELQLI